MFRYGQGEVKTAAKYGPARKRIDDAVRRTSGQGRRWLTVNAVARNHAGTPLRTAWLRIAAIAAANPSLIDEETRAWAYDAAHAHADEVIRVLGYIPDGAFARQTANCLARGMLADNVMSLVDDAVDTTLRARWIDTETTREALGAALRDAEAAAVAARSAECEASRLARRANGRAPAAVAAAEAAEADARVFEVSARLVADAAHAADSAAWKEALDIQDELVEYVRAEYSRLADLAERLAERFPLDAPTREPVVAVARIPYAGGWDGATSFDRSICCGNYWFGANVTGPFEAVTVTLASADDDMRRIQRAAWRATGTVNVQTWTRHTRHDYDLVAGQVWGSLDLPVPPLTWNVVDVQPRDADPAGGGCVDSLGRW